MPDFTRFITVAAPLEEVWKLLHDPSRFPEWWAGIETVVTNGQSAYTMWPVGYPDFPMAQRLDAAPADNRVTISCLVSDLEFRWQLSPVGESTAVEVQVRIPEGESHRLATQQGLIEKSLWQLAALAATGSSSGRGLPA